MKEKEMEIEMEMKMKMEREWTKEIKGNGAKYIKRLETCCCAEVLMHPGSLQACSAHDSPAVTKWLLVACLT